MSRTTRGTAETAQSSVIRTRIAPVARPAATRTTRNAVQQRTEADDGTTTPAVARATRRVRADVVSNSDAKDASAGPSVSRAKTAASRTIAKKPAPGAAGKLDEGNKSSKSTSRTRPPTTTTTKPSSKTITPRSAAPSKIRIVEDALSLTKDFQAILRPSVPGASTSDSASPTHAAMRSPEENEVDVLGRYLSRALTLSESHGTSVKSASRSSTRDTASEIAAAETVKRRQEANRSALTDATDPSNEAPQESERSSIEVKHEINLAKHVINAGLRTLLNVYHSGYRKTTTAQPSATAPAGKEKPWNDGDVMNVVDACWQAFKTIDRLQPQTQTVAQKTLANNPDSQNTVEEEEKENSAIACAASGDTASTCQESSKGKKNVALEMEKIRVVLISRCWMLGMVCDTYLNCQIVG